MHFLALFSKVLLHTAMFSCVCHDYYTVSCIRVRAGVTSNGWKSTEE